MKFNKKNLMYILLVICLLLCIIAVKILEANKEQCATINFDDLLIDINTATNIGFEKIDNNLSYDLPIEFDEKTEFIYASDVEKSNYFILVRDLSKEDMSEITSFVDMKEKSKETIKFEQYNDYIYIISSNEHTSTIDGIITSYIYCEKRD